MIMTVKQKEQLSSFMDDELQDVSFLNENQNNDGLQATWHRYHLIRETIQGRAHNCSYSLDITKQVASIIGDDEEIHYGQSQPTPQTAERFKPQNLFWLKTKDLFSRVGQVGLAACVTLAIIAGVQYQQNSKDTNDLPVLNTMPVGVSVSPVGGLNRTQDELNVNSKEMTQEQYDKIRLLLQNYELQKRLNAQ